jgi:hypothetical protein
MIPVTDNDTSAFFGQHATTDVPRDQWKRYILPDPRTGEKVDGWTRATTFAATVAESYAIQIWKQRQVVWGLSRRPDLITMASTISGPEDKSALGEIVDEAHIAGGTDAKKNRGNAIHRACQAAERGAYAEVPEELRPHVAGYFAELSKWNLTMLPELVERTIIVDRYHVAGTFDNVYLCPDGKYRIGDKKTGNLDYADTEFAIQLALYAHADAMFDYSTGRYVALPKIETDYAIIMHIDPDTGRCEAQRVDIERGWLWARTCAEVMDIRKTKHVITPYVPDTVRPSTTFDARAAFPVAGTPVALTQVRDTPAELRYNPEDAVAAQQYIDTQLPADPLMGNNTGTPLGILHGAVGLSGTGLHAAAEQDYQRWSANESAAYVAAQDPFAAFWTDSELDEDDGAEPVNGVSLAQYGQPSQWPCARNEPCEFTGADGLHSDGTVCLFGNQRPAPVAVLPGEQVRWDNGVMVVQRDGQWVPGAEQTLDEPVGVDEWQPGMPPIEITQQVGVVAEELGVVGAQPLRNTPDDAALDALGHAAPDDAMVAKVMKAHRDKAAMQKLATQLMQSVGVKEGDPDGIKLAQYKVDLANAIVTLAYRTGVAVPDLGVPTGPGHPKTKGKATAAEKKAVAKSAEDTAAQAAKDRAEVIATAVRSIQQQGTIDGLNERHSYYATTSVGWTEEMQVAARTRALEIDAAAGTEALTPDQMIDGATSLETLGKAYQKATNNGQNMAGWTTELNAKAQVKHTELQQLATSVNQ